MPSPLPGTRNKLQRPSLLMVASADPVADTLRSEYVFVSRVTGDSFPLG